MWNPRGDLRKPRGIAISTVAEPLSELGEYYTGRTRDPPHGVLPSGCLGKRGTSPPEPPTNPPLRVHGLLITAAIEVGGRWVDVTVDTGTSRSFANESFTSLVARAVEVLK